jgi:hypothetical protein
MMILWSARSTIDESNNGQNRTSCRLRVSRSQYPPLSCWYSPFFHPVKSLPNADFDVNESVGTVSLSTLRGSLSSC